MHRAINSLLDKQLILREEGPIDSTALNLVPIEGISYKNDRFPSGNGGFVPPVI